MNVQKAIEEKRSKLFVFAGVSFLVLTFAFLYLEVYDPHDIPNFFRAFFALYWIYSVVAIYISKRGSDKWVSKICWNIFRECRVGE